MTNSECGGRTADKGTAQEQKESMWSAHEKIMRVMRAYIEIMSSGNPRSLEEVRSLVKKRPEVYGCLYNVAYDKEERQGKS